jgi:hypothetical protein
MLGCWLILFLASFPAIKLAGLCILLQEARIQKGFCIPNTSGAPRNL